MKKLTTLIAVLALGGLAACGGGTEETPAPTENKAQAPEGAQTKARSPEVQAIETAMAEIPPELREDFQKALGCRLKGDNPPAINGDYVRQLTRELQQNRSIANC